MISIIKRRKIWLTTSTLMTIVGLVSFIMFGLKLGIDFTGGSLMELEFAVSVPTNQQINEALVSIDINNAVIQPVGEQGITIRAQDIDEATHQKILETLKQKFQPELPQSDSGIIMEAKVLEEKRFDSIGPSIGQELKNKTVWGIIIVSVAIIAYIAWAFRKISKPVASWKFGTIAVISLMHDIIITAGIFAILGKFYGIEVNAPFIAALLTIFGYSNNDTIVVFDRIRENLIRHMGEDFETIVEKSINEVIVRSINTSFTVLLALFALLIFGGATIRDFVLALIIGVTIGTYSSIFLASPLLVVWEKFRSNR
ncbi:MAG: protein translocase subunit SecF [Patescibacteria group bacterium]|jgi:preprotein translocase subunit SecF